ncbi:hypothetical protein F5B18DRAFT_647356 [Nemania serpens]|nr:hypothetical protein F5B18DRAFT_647356 [Nemania serpens]
MAKEIKWPDFPHTLSQAEHCIFDNFQQMADLQASTITLVEELAEATARLERKVDKILATYDPAQQTSEAEASRASFFDAPSSSATPHTPRKGASAATTTPVKRKAASFRTSYSKAKAPRLSLSPITTGRRSARSADHRPARDRRRRHASSDGGLDSFPCSPLPVGSKPPWPNEGRPRGAPSPPSPYQERLSPALLGTDPPNSGSEVSLSGATGPEHHFLEDVMDEDGRGGE